MNFKTIKKAVITAAGKGTRQYPATNAVQKELFPLVDRDGITKPTIQIIAEEALNAGIEEICLIVQAGAQEQFKKHFQGLTRQEASLFSDKPWVCSQSRILQRLQKAIVYIEQNQQEGFGHAVYCAKEWVGNEPFLLMLGDHIYISENSKSCAIQLIDGYKIHQKSTIGLKQTPIEQIHLFGTATGNQISDNPPTFRLTRVAEKPDAQYAKKHLSVPCLPDGLFLCFFGLYLFTPIIFSILDEHIKKNMKEKGEFQLTSAIAYLLKNEGVLGLEIDGSRLDMGTPSGYIETQLALAHSGILSEELEKHIPHKTKESNSENA